MRVALLPLLLVAAGLAAATSIRAQDQLACQQGLEAQDRGDRQLAIEFYNRCLAAGGLTADSAAFFHYARGSLFADLEAYALALPDLTEAIRLLPGNIDAYNDRGVVHHMLGDLDSAIADFDRAIQLDPNDQYAYANRGIAHREKGQLRQAIADFTRAIALYSGDAHSYHNRGIAYLDRGQYELAVADFDKAIRWDPGMVLAYESRGLALQEMGLLDRAIADFDTMVQLDPSDPFAFSNRGWAKREKGRIEAAIADFDRAIALDPGNDDAFNGRAYARAAAGDLEGARGDVDKALALRPGDPHITDTLGDILCLQGQTDEALATWGRALAVSTDALSDKQRKLRRAGFYEGVSDGVAGADLDAALRSWAEAGCPGF